eukprot:3175933-Prorocentrum_lima.AAC.1
MRAQRNRAYPTRQPCQSQCTNPYTLTWFDMFLRAERTAHMENARMLRNQNNHTGDQERQPQPGTSNRP